MTADLMTLHWEALLAPFLAAKALSPLDYRFALALGRMAPEPPTDAVILGAAAASAALTRGDICLELSRAADLLAPADEDAPLSERPNWPEPNAWRAALMRSPLVSDGTARAPLVLDGERLYLHRYFDYQRRLARALTERRDTTFVVDDQRLRETLDRLFADFPAPEAQANFRSLSKLVAFDTALAMDTYIAANLDTVARHQAAIRELSTPVIRVYDRVLLLPLVGTVDTHRAQQIMETLLTRTVEDQAKAIIVDIAGVPVVDTKVADHLLKTTAAVRMLGAVTIITGISAQVARTMVQLGVDLSSIETRARLADGIELALAKVGRVIAEKGVKA